MSKYYKIKYDCGCEYEGHSPSSPRCPADHYSKIIEYYWRDKLSNQVQAGVMPNEVLAGGSLHLAKQIREHLNSVGYDLGPTTEKLIKQVIDIESQREA